MTNLEIIDKFLKSNSCSELGESTKKQYRDELIVAFDSMSNVNYENLKMKNLQDYTDYLSDRYENPSSYNKKLASFRKFIQYIVAYEYNEHIKLDMFKQEFGTKKKGSRLGKGDKPMTIEEYFAFNKYVLNKKCKTWLTQRQKVATLLISTLGLRRIEVVGLKKTDINRDRMTVNPTITKGNKPRQLDAVIISKEVLIEIDKLYELYEQNNIVGEYVIMNRDGKCLQSENHVNEMINGETIYKEDGTIDESRSNGIVGMAIRRGFISFRVLPHGIRKSCGMVLRHYFNWDLEKVRDFLGHESIQTTEIYTQLRIDGKNHGTLNMFSME